MKNLFILSIISTTMAMVGCVSLGLHGHQSANSPVVDHIITEHKLILIAETPKGLGLGTGEISAEQTSIYQANHKKTVICDNRHYYAASSTATAEKQTQITLVSGETITVAKTCYIANANPAHSIYVAKSSVHQHD